MTVAAYPDRGATNFTTHDNRLIENAADIIYEIKDQQPHVRHVRMNRML
jgi:hypothetical protein